MHSPCTSKCERTQFPLVFICMRLETQVMRSHASEGLKVHWCGDEGGIRAWLLRDACHVSRDRSLCGMRAQLTGDPNEGDPGTFGNDWSCVLQRSGYLCEGGWVCHQDSLCRETAVFTRIDDTTLAMHKRVLTSCRATFGTSLSES